MSEVMKDIFICHASEDKTEIVRPLVNAFEQVHISCWFDEDEMRVGESIVEQVNEGLRSRYLLAVVSAAFMSKAFPREELKTALNKQASTGEVHVFLLFVGAEEDLEDLKEELWRQFPLLKDRHSLSWQGSPDAIVNALLPTLRPNFKAVTNVCFISSEYPPHVVGGLGVHVKQLTTALGAHLHVNVVLPTPERVPYQSCPPQVHLEPLSRTNASYENPVSWLRFAEVATQRIMLIARNTRPDVIHCHDWVTVLAGIKCRWHLNIPLLFHLHLPNLSPLCASVENLGLVCADVVTVSSGAMYEELIDRGLQLRHVEVVKNGVNVDAFHPCDDWPVDDGYILFVGRLENQKGVKYLVRAFDYVREKFPDVRLKIVGDGGLREQLERLCTTLVLSNRVEFLGWKTGQELVRLYQKALVVTVPSIYEPFGMTALEALACQRPVVATRVGGLKEIITPDVNGFLAEPQDELTLAQWLMALLSNSDLRHRLGKDGRRYVSTRGFLWPQIAQQFIRLYKVLQEKPLDKSLPDMAEEYKNQIVKVAQEMDPHKAQNSLSYTNQLFDWMVKS
jgi:glycosyltransferase involved in cell wall biosynthesis